MKRFFHKCRMDHTKVLVILLLSACLLCPCYAWGEDSPGLSLSIYIDQAHEDLQYALGEPIKLIMRIKNIWGYPINTERGFSKVELHQSLVITDPAGTTHSLSQETVVLDPLPPFFLKDQATSPAETVPLDWVRSVAIDDLGDLFPMMKTTAGWYTIEAQQPFVRFAKTVQHDRLGLLGLQEHPGNWHGTISSNRIQIQIAPGDGDQGAYLQVQVLDGSSQPLSQVPVKVFKTNDIPEGYDLCDAWAKTTPVLEGLTDSEGWATWPSGASCMPQDEYTTIAYYQNEYKAGFFPREDDGWGPGCGGELQNQILFGEPPVSNKFSVFALNSVWIRSKAIVFTGNIGALDASPGPCLSSGVEVLIGVKAKAMNGVQIFGDSVKIQQKASVFDVFYNELENRGTIRGQEMTPLDLPVQTQLPPSLNVSPGEDPVTVRPKKVLDLDPGFYGDVKIRTKGTLRLAGGTYHFNSLNLGPKASMICITHTEIRIKERLYPGAKAYLGPSPNSSLSAKDVFLYVEGVNGKKGKLRSNPKVAVIGVRNEFKANIYAPNGTLWIREGCVVEGSFIAKDVIVGVKAKVKLDSAF